MEKIPSASRHEALPKLTSEEQQFLEDYGRRLDAMLDAVSAQRGPTLGRFLRSLAHADTWRVIIDRRKAEHLIDKGLMAKTDAATFSEFNRKLAALDHRLLDFPETLTGDAPPSVH